MKINGIIVMRINEKKLGKGCMGLESVDGVGIFGEEAKESPEKVTFDLEVSKRE